MVLFGWFIQIFSVRAGGRRRCLYMVTRVRGVIQRGVRRRDIFHCQASAQLLSSKLYRIVLIRGSNFNCKLDLESVGSSLRFEGELIWAGLDWRGPDISSGLVNRHLTRLGVDRVKPWN